MRFLILCVFSTASLGICSGLECGSEPNPGKQTYEDQDWPKIPLDYDGESIGYFPLPPKWDTPPRPLPEHCPPVISKQEFQLPGKVIVQIYIDNSGNVRKWRLATEKPKGLGFSEEVIKTIVQWKFTPALAGGKPTGVWIAVPFKFKVGEKHSDSPTTY